MCRFCGPASKIGISRELCIKFYSAIHLIEGNHLLELFKIYCFKRFFHNYFLNVDISLNPVWLSMKSLPVVYNIQIEGRVSQIFYICLSFYFMVKNGKLFVIVFMTFSPHFLK